MVYYYLGHLHQLRQDNEAAMKYYARASTLPHDRCYPFRNESIAVLKAAIEANPKDARAPYYLGNLLYDKQPQQAIKYWEQARELDGAFALVHRNLGWGYYHVQHDVSKAIASYETSFKYNSRDPRLLGLARQAGATVTVVDMGVAADLGPLAAAGKILSRRIGPGTRNMAKGPAMGTVTDSPR
jgi:tetratricopeptide (TPR) repeat protein